MRTLKKRIKQFIKDLCWIIFSILIIILMGIPLFIFSSPLFVYSYGDRLTSKGFMRFLILWLLVFILYLFNILNKTLF